MKNGLKIVTWNAFSLRARIDFLAAYLDAEQPDVIAIQEVKLEEHAVPVEVFESRGYHVAIHGQKQWNGVLIASKEPITDVSKGLPGGDDGQARLIAGTTFGVRFVNLYCPQGSSVSSPKFAYKLRFFDTLIDWLTANYTPTEPLCVLGDINIAPNPEDVYSVEKMSGVPTYHPLEHERWHKLLDWGLHDAVLPFVEPGKFSFWDYQRGAFHKNQGFRIDHLLVTEPLRKRVRDAFIQRPWRKKQGDLKPSDHCPVGIVVD
jgi:exodeoxyribonuclease III